MKGQRLSKKVRFRTGRTMAWPAVLDDFDYFISVNPQYEPMRQLVYSLHACAPSDLHATQIMGGNLLVSPEEELCRDDNVLLVSYKPQQRKFHFEHRMTSNNNDAKDARIEDAWATLRLFVGYKFGIRLPASKPNTKVP